VQPFNADFSPRGTYYGTVGTFRRDVSIAAGEWIIYDHHGFQTKRSDKEFRERYEEWHGIHYDGPWIPVEHSTPQEFGDVLVARWYDNPLGGRYSIELAYWEGCWKWDRPDRRTLYWMYLPPWPPHPPKPDLSEEEPHET
jgi:hypothetical protein